MECTCRLNRLSYNLPLSSTICRLIPVVNLYLDHGLMTTVQNQNLPLPRNITDPYYRVASVAPTCDMYKGSCTLSERLFGSYFDAAHHSMVNCLQESYATAIGRLATLVMRRLGEDKDGFTVLSHTPKPSADCLTIAT